LGPQKVWELAMLTVKKILFQIETNIEAVINEDTALGKDLWEILIVQHHADIAMLIERLDESYQIPLFKKLSKDLALGVFKKLEPHMQAAVLVSLDLDDATNLLKQVSVDELTDVFDHLSDEDLEKYLKLLQREQRRKVISLLHFNPESAGGRMSSDVITFHKDFTVRRCIEILQRLGENKIITQRLYVTNEDNVLQGYVTLDKLVLSKPETFLANIMLPNELQVGVDEDQEEVANQMHHYELMYVPVVDKQNHFLGIITADDVVDIIKQEEGEDVYKMSGVTPVDHSYFATTIWTLVWQRMPWLVGLLLLQSISSTILLSYSLLLARYTIISGFLTMLMGTGGNAGNQATAVVLRGLTTKEMSRHNSYKVLWREFLASLVIGSILVTISFFRVYFSSYDMLGSIAISVSLFLIIIASVVLGAFIPIMLERFGVDPAHSAAPFLATLMDVLGTVILCLVSSKILG